MTNPHVYEQKTVSLEKTELAKTARKKLSAIGGGNGLTDDQVRLVTTREKMYDFPGFLVVKIKPEYAEHREPGKAQGDAKEVRSPEEVIQLAEAKAHEMLTEKEPRKEVIKAITEYEKKKEKDPGEGWGLHGEKIRLHLAKPTFALTEPCPGCKAQGTGKCPECHGSARINCPSCKSVGKTTCPVCMGDKKVAGPGGEMIDCVSCSGMGKVQCKKCFGQMTIPCPKCKGVGTAKCNECQGQGWYTTMTHVHYNALTEFDIDKRELPDTMAKVINEIKAKPLRQLGHCKTELIGDNEEELDPMTLIYMARMPFAEAEYVIDEEPLHCKVVGFNVMIMDCPPFLDPLIKPGIHAMAAVAKGEKPTSTLVKAAQKFRIIREALALTSGRTRGQVVKRLLKTYDVGLSAAYAKALAHQSHLALKKVSVVPRYIGLAFGSAASFLAMWMYHMTGIRVQLFDTVGKNHQTLTGIDVALPLLMLFVTIYSIKYAAKNAVLSVAPGSTGLPRVGQAGTWAIGIILVMWLGVLEVSFIKDIAPYWYEMLRGRVTGLFG